MFSAAPEPPTIGNLLALTSILVAIIVQSFSFWKWMTAQFKARDEAIDRSKVERDQKLEALRSEIAADQRVLEADMRRIERDMTDVREKLQQMPTRQELERLMERKVDPLHELIHTLTIELARGGLLERRKPAPAPVEPAEVADADQQ